MSRIWEYTVDEIGCFKPWWAVLCQKPDLVERIKILSRKMLVADEGKFCDSTSPLIPEILALKDEAFGFMSAAGHLVPAEMRTRFWSYCLYHDGCGCEFDLERATREAFEYFGPEGIQELVDQGVASFYPWPEPGPSTQTIYK